MNRNMAVGRFGEDAAAQYLTSVGMAILERNWRCRYGEIDIVAHDGPTLVVCEVKTRTSEAFGSAAEAVTPRKLRRLRHLAYRWLDEHDLHAPRIRIDVIAVTRPLIGGTRIEHLRGVDDDGGH